MNHHPDTTPLSMEQMLTRAGRGLRKVDVHGERGCSMVTMQEIEAMAVLLRALGLPPVAPGKVLHLPGTPLTPLPAMEIRNA